ncbi:hypothetical protein ABG768_002057 [Culter alburnus]|uniref:Uncharacterized protein n=1 Tax=Culter alburnus TaxID=194366 RepID=A0AAW2A3K3_CULAL
MLGKIQKVNVAQLRPYFRPQDHSHESEGSQNDAEDIGLVDHQYANKGPLWSKKLCPQQEQVLTYVLDRTRPAKEIVVLDGPVCLQREDFWSLGLDEQMESNIGNACFRLVEEAARRHGMDVHIADLFEVPKWKLREPSLPWWCLQILEKFSITRHGQNFGQRFAFWTEEAEQLMAGTLPPIYRIYRPQIVKEQVVEVEELPLTLKHMYQAEYIVRNSVGLFTGQVQEPTYMLMDHDDQRKAWRVLMDSMKCDAMEPFTFIFENIQDMETFMVICKDTLNLRVNAGVGVHSHPYTFC